MRPSRPLAADAHSYVDEPLGEQIVRVLAFVSNAASRSIVVSLA